MTTGTPADRMNDNELVNMVRFISHVVQAVLEATLDSFLFCLLVIPLCVPWRTAATLATAFPAGWPSGEWRVEYRKRAMIAILSSLGDLLIIPLIGLALLFPSRTWPIAEAFQHRSNMGTTFNIDYNLRLRQFLLAQFAFGCLDAMCFVPALIVLLHPWRTVELLFVSRVILRDVDDIGGTYDEDRFDWTVGRWGGLLSDIRKWVFSSFCSTLLDLPSVALGLASLAVPSRMLPLLTELPIVIREGRRKFEYHGGAKGVNVIDWHEGHKLFAQSAFYAVIDVFMLPLVLFVLVTQIRALPLIVDVNRDWPNGPRFVIINLQQNILGGGRVTRLSRRRTENDTLVEAFMPTHSGVGDADGCGVRDSDGFDLCSELNGRYQLFGVFRGGALFKRVLSNTGDDSVLLAPRAAFLTFWEGYWHIQLTRDVATDVVRFKTAGREDALNPVHGEDYEILIRQCGGSGCVGGGKDLWVPLDDPGVERAELLRVQGPDSSANWEIAAFGRRGFNARLRWHCVLHACYLVLDVFFLPFFFLTLLSVYRVPGLLRRMREDSLIHLAKSLGIQKLTLSEDDDTSDGISSESEAFDSGYSFGYSSRVETLRQCALLLLDLLVFPFLLIIAFTGYRLPHLVGQFQYYDVSWHICVLLNANCVLYDGLVFLPAALVYCTVYRYKYVLQASKAAPVVPHGKVDWRFRIELVRQAALLCCDMAVAPFYLLVHATRYRVRYIEGTFSPFTLRFHAAVLESGTMILFDAIVLGALCVLLGLSVHRLIVIVRVIRCPPPPVEGRSVDAQNRIREEVCIQTLLFIFDMLVIPFALLCLVTVYRWKYVAQHLPSISQVVVGSGFSVPGSGHQADFHLAAFYNTGIVLHDVALMLPASCLMLLTVYRAGIVVSAVSQSLGPLLSFIVLALRKSRQQEAQVGNAAHERHVEADVDVVDYERGLERAQVPRDGPEDERWHAIAQELIGADPQWGELVDWNAAPRVPEWQPFSRTEFWTEFQSLVVDLPFLLMGLIVFLSLWRSTTLIRRVREQRQDSCRRKAVAWQVAFTFRDLLVMPVFLLLLFTPQGPRICTRLCSRRRSSGLVQAAPALELLALEVTVPEVGKPLLCIRAQCAEQLGALAPGSLRVQIGGGAFWRSFTTAFGRLRASIAQNVLPIRLGEADTDLDAALAGVAGQHGLRAAFEAQREVCFFVQCPLSTKRRNALAKLAKLPQDGQFLFQLEAKEASSGRERVVCAAAIQVSMTKSLVQAGGGRIAEDALGNPDACRTTTSHRGVAESFACLVGMEIADLLFNLLHLLLFFIVVLVPWRFTWLVVYLMEPPERWPWRVCLHALEVMKDTNTVLQELRGELLVLCNGVAKSPELAAAWCGEVAKLPMPIQRFDSDAFREHRQFVWLLNQMLDDMPQNTTEKLRTWLEMHDARLFFAALAAYANCLLSVGRITVEEHGVIIEGVRVSEASFVEACANAYDDVRYEVKHCWAEVRTQGWQGAGLWNKDAATNRKIIQSMATAAAVDCAGIFMCALVVVTIYRVPGLVMSVFREGAFQPTSNKFKAIVVRNLRACALEISLAVQIVFLWLLLLITLVRLPEALEEMVSTSHTLRSMRDMLLRQFRNALRALWELVVLLPAIRTLRLVVRATLHMCLVPPACLSELISRVTANRLHLGARLVACILFFYALALFPAFTRLPSPPAGAATVRLVFLVMSTILVISNILSIIRVNAFLLPQRDGWVSPGMRVTWGNIMSVSCLLSQPVTLIVFLVARHSSHLPWLDASCSTAETVGIVALVVVMLWLLLVSVMFVTGQSVENQHLQRSPLLHLLQLLLSHLLFLPTILGLLAPSIGGCRYSIDAGLSPVECVLLSALGCYLLTTQMLSSDSGLLHPLTWECGVDARYPTAFIMVTQFLDFLVVAASVVAADSELVQLAVAILAMAGSALWTLFYRRLFGVLPCCVLHVTVARGGGALALLWTTSCLVFLELPEIFAVESRGALLFSGIVVICFGTLFAAHRARTLARLQSLRLVEESGMQDIVAQLARVTEGLCIEEHVPGTTRQRSRESSWRRGRWERSVCGALTTKAIALKMLEFEDRVLAEHLDDSFLRVRVKWREDVLCAKELTVLVELVRHLHAGLRSPSTVSELTRIGRQLFGRRDICALLVNLLVGHESLSTLLLPALLTTSSGRGSINMPVHCKHARVALEDVLRCFGKCCAFPSQDLTWRLRSLRSGHTYAPSGARVTSELVEGMYAARAPAVRREGGPAGGGACSIGASSSRLHTCGSTVGGDEEALPSSVHPHQVALALDQRSALEKKRLDGREEHTSSLTELPQPAVVGASLGNMRNRGPCAPISILAHQASHESENFQVW